MVYENICLPQSNHQYNNRTTEDITTFYYRTDAFKFYYFPATIMEWNKLDVTLRNSESLPYFRRLVGPQLNRFIIFIIPLVWNFSPHFGLSHLNEHRFKHNFQDCINPLCTCSLEIESLSYFFLHCHYFTNIRSTLFSELQSVDVNIAKLSDNEIVDLLLYGSPKFDTD